MLCKDEFLRIFVLLAYHNEVVRMDNFHQSTEDKILVCRPLPGAQINPLAEDATIKKIPLKEAPEDLFSLGRTIMILRGLCHALSLDIQVTKSIHLLYMVKRTAYRTCCRSSDPKYR